MLAKSWSVTMAELAASGNVGLWARVARSDIGACCDPDADLQARRVGIARLELVWRALRRSFMSRVWVRVGFALLVAPLAFVAVDSSAAAAVAVIATVAGPAFLRDSRKRRRRRTLDAQLANLMELLARSLGAGASLRQAFSTVAPRLHEPLASEMALVNSWIEFGEPPHLAFSRMADATNSDLYSLSARVFRFHARSGGQIVATLRRLAHVVRDRRAGAAEIASLTSQGRLSGLVVGLAPVGMSLVIPADVGAMPIWLRVSTESVGWALVAVGLAIIWKITNPDATSRSAEPERGLPCLSRFLRKNRHKSALAAVPGADRGRASWLIRALGRALPERWRTDEHNRRLAVAAGHSAPDRECLEMMSGNRVMLAIVGLMVGLALSKSITGVAVALTLGVAGWFAIELPLRRAAASRRAAIDEAVPQLCDILAIGLGSGANVENAFDKIGDFSGPIGSRLDEMRRRVSVGVPFGDALIAFADGSGSDDLADVCATIAEGRRRGGPMVGLLDDLARDMRKRDQMRRQGQARKLPVKILFPLVFCVLPAFVVLTIVPLVASTIASLAL